MDQFSFKVNWFPSDKWVESIQKCVSNIPECITIGYHIIGGKYEEWYHSIMRHVAKENGLKYGVDIKMTSKGSP